MADRKISDLTALTTPASGDYLPIVDISEAAAASKNKRITIEELMRGMPDGTAAAPGIAFETDPNTGIYSPGADQLAVSTGGTGRLFVDASGNVSINNSTAFGNTLYVAGNINAASTIRTDVGSGVTSLILAGVGSNFQVSHPTAGIVNVLNSGGGFTLTTDSGEKVRITSSGNVGIGTSSPAAALHTVSASAGANSARFSDGVNSTLLIGHAATNLAYLDAFNNLGFYISGTERLRIDSSGRLLVGTSTARSNFYNTTASAAFQLEGTGTNRRAAIIGDDAEGVLILAAQKSGAVGGNQVLASGDPIGALSFQGSDGSEFVEAATIYAYVDGTPGANDMPGRLVFSTTADGASSPTERMRITSAGSAQYAAATTGIVSGSVSAAGTTYTTFIGQYNTSSGPGSGTNSFLVYTNGNVQNTNNSYGAISDVKLKENIADATSQWSDIKALQVRKYNFKEGQTHTQIGLVAQEVELVSPGLVTESPDRDEDGNDLGTVTKSVNYSVLYMKAVKALQEAMERIETLEAAVAALSG